MGLLIHVLIAAIVALIVYFVATALIHGFVLIIGLVCLVIFLAVAFGPWYGGTTTAAGGRRRFW